MENIFKVVEIIANFRESERFNYEKLSRELNISRIKLKKYINYLEEDNILSIRNKTIVFNDHLSLTRVGKIKLTKKSFIQESGNVKLFVNGFDYGNCESRFDFENRPLVWNAVFFTLYIKEMYKFETDSKFKYENYRCRITKSIKLFRIAEPVLSITYFSDSDRLTI